MSIRNIAKFIGYLLGCVGVVLVVGFSFGYMNSLSTRLLEKSASEENLAVAAAYVNLGNPDLPVTTIYRGKAFFVHYKMRREQLCNSEFNTSIRNEATGTSDLLRFTQNWSQVGDITANELFEINKDLPKGTYTITKREIRHCAGVTSYAIVFKVIAIVDDMPVQVVQPKPVQVSKPTQSAPTSQKPMVQSKEEMSNNPFNWHWFKSWN